MSNRDTLVQYLSDNKWPEIVTLPDKTELTVGYLFHGELLCYYPHPVEVVYSNGGEFLGIEFQEMLAVTASPQNLPQ